MKRYVATPDWTGEPVAIVASGLSASSFDFSLVKGWRTIAVKDGFQLAPEADVLMIGDHRYVKRRPDLSGYRGPLILYTDPEPLPPELHDDRVQFIPKVPGRGLSRNPAELRGTFTTTCLAISLAFLRGSREIVLIGVDGHAGPKGERHFTGGLIENWHDRYGRQKWGYQRLEDDIKKFKVKVWNANPKSSVKSFRTWTPPTDNPVVVGR